MYLYPQNYVVPLITQWLRTLKKKCFRMDTLTGALENNRGPGPPLEILNL